MKQNETQKESKSSEIFVCKCCDYNTSRRGQYDRHLATDKHQNRSNETNMKQKSSEKFQCEKCDYSTSRKSQYDRHLQTDKHKILHNPTSKSSKNLFDKTWNCECGKITKNYK